MDRTSWIGVIVCAILFFVWTWYAKHTFPPKQTHLTTSSLSTSPTSQDSSSTPSLTAGNPSALKPLPASTPEQTITLENDSIRVLFTSHGGAIKKIDLLQHMGKSKTENIVLHEHSPIPFLARSGWNEGSEIYTLEKQGNQILAKTALNNGLVVERLYSIQNQYQITLQETLRNPSLQTIVLPNFELSLGSGEPIHPHDPITHLKAGWLARETESYKSNAVANMSGGLFKQAKTQIVETTPNLDWAATTNQFFASIVRVPAELKSVEMNWNKIELPKEGDKPTPHLVAMQAEVSFQGLALNPQSTSSWTYEVYTGPKEYALLKNFPDHQSNVVEFGIWGWVIKPLLAVMHYLHQPLSWFGNLYKLNYGWVIILLTVILKLVFWPLQSAANTSMKKMQALAPKMEELKKKHEKDPQKMNAEVMKLYRDYGVNPVGGCLPMLVQLPIFFGLYTMLQSAVEVRNESFLWIHDLAQPDTIYTITGLGWDINPLPLIMTATSILLMKMTPQSSDNPQMKMFQFMPLLFLFMLYNFAAALSLYQTVNTLISMVQTYRNIKTAPPTLQRVKKKKPFGFGNLPSA
ncbi:MAG: membrane protein insertase YidC [Verrucomicrobiota bacterium]